MAVRIRLTPAVRSGFLTWYLPRDTVLRVLDRLHITTAANLAKPEYLEKVRHPTQPEIFTSRIVIQESGFAYIYLFTFLRKDEGETFDAIDLSIHRRPVSEP